MINTAFLAILCARYNTASFLAAYFWQLGSQRQFSQFYEIGAEILGIIKDYQDLEKFEIVNYTDTKGTISYDAVRPMGGYQ